MEFQPLPDIGLRTFPNIECQMIEDLLGVKIPVPPIKLVMTEGNKRVIKKSGDPVLLRAIGEVDPSGRWFGTYIFYPYNFFVLRSLNHPEESKQAAIHENGHALYYQIKALTVSDDQSSQKQDTPISAIPGISPEKDRFLTDYLFKEGFADYIATSTLLRQRTLSDEERTKLHLRIIATRLLVSRKGEKNINTNPDLIYDFGHRFVFLVMTFLTSKCQMSITEALAKIALNPPRSLSWINELTPKNYLNSLNLPVSITDNFAESKAKLSLGI